MHYLQNLYLMPHPPIILPEVGKGEERKIQATTDALNLCSTEILKKAPKTIILITPHGTLVGNRIVVSLISTLEGNLSRFGAQNVSMSFCNDLEMAQDIVAKSTSNSIPCLGWDENSYSKYGILNALDWGAIVPLYFVVKNLQHFKLIHIAVPMLSHEVLYRFGSIIQESIKSGKRDTVVICSGDLSHVLSQRGPYGFHPSGQMLDNRILELLRRSDVHGLLNLDLKLVNEGKECALRPLIIGLGILNGHCFESSILSYEKPFGVGYAVVKIDPMLQQTIKLDADKSRFLTHNDASAVGETESKDPYVELAIKSLSYYVKFKKVLDPETENTIPELINRRAGVFVSIKKADKLRGCIGTLSPSKQNVALEIIHNAISAGTEDIRFKPISENELEELVISVDVLSEPSKIISFDELDAKKYGVIVKCGRRTGVLLPDIEGVNTPMEQIEIALSKAGIRMNESYIVERFEVERHR